MMLWCSGQCIVPFFFFFFSFNWEECFVVLPLLFFYSLQIVPLHVSVVFIYPLGVLCIVFSGCNNILSYINELCLRAMLL